MKKSFLLLSFLILFTAGVAKLVESQLNGTYLNDYNPVFDFFTNRMVFIFAGTLEVGVALFLLNSNDVKAKCWVLLWLSAILWVYRLALVILQYPEPCSCMGGLVSWLKIPTTAANNMFKGILIFLSFGSLAFLFLGRDTSGTSSAGNSGEGGHLGKLA